MSTEVETPQIANEEPEVEEIQETKLEGQALTDAIKEQVEFYFSQENLCNDAHLVSQMNGQRFVPIASIVQFKRIASLTSDSALVASSIAGSTVCTLSPDGTMIRPNFQLPRNTIILRDIPSETDEAEVQGIFESEKCGKVTGIRSDVGDTWFVTMESEESAVSTLLYLRGQTFKGKAIKGRLKSANILRSTFKVQAAAEGTGGAGAGAGAGAAYQGGMEMYGNYGMQYMGMQYYPPQMYGGGGYMYDPAQQQDGSQYGNGSNAGGNGGNSGGRPFNGGHRGRGPRRGPHGPKGGMRGHNMRGGKGRPGPNRKAGGRGGHHNHAARSPAPKFTATSFPPLPGAEEGFGRDFRKYSSEELMGIVRAIPAEQITMPPALLAGDPNKVVLVMEPNTALLNRQRTESMEVALRRGRPLRPERAYSEDYDSMLYGEDAAARARANKQAGANTAAAAAKQSAPAATAAAGPSDSAATGAAAAADGAAAAEDSSDQQAASGETAPAAATDVAAPKAASGRSWANALVTGKKASPKPAAAATAAAPAAAAAGAASTATPKKKAAAGAATKGGSSKKRGAKGGKAASKGAAGKGAAGKGKGAAAAESAQAKGGAAAGSAWGAKSFADALKSSEEAEKEAEQTKRAAFGKLKQATSPKKSDGGAKPSSSR